MAAFTNFAPAMEPPARAPCNRPRGLGDESLADHAARACPVLDEHLLAQELREPALAAARRSRRRRPGPWRRRNEWAWSDNFALTRPTQKSVASTAMAMRIGLCLTGQVSESAQIVRAQFHA